MAERQVKVAILGDSKGLTGALDAAEARMGGFASKIPAFGGLLAGALGIGVVVGLEQIGASFDDAFDKIRISTGQTGDTLKGLQGSFKTVFADVPASMDTVAQAISGVNQKLGLTGKPLEDLSEQLVNLSRITDTDLGTNISSVTDLFNNFGVSVQDQGGKLDELFRVAQQSGASVSDLATAMSDSGAQFRAAGLTFDESASLLGLLAKNGLDAGDVIPALSRSMATAAKDGKPAAQVFKDTFDAIKNAPDDTKAAGVALDVFGAKAGPKFAALIREGKLSYEDFAKAVSAGGDTINQAASDTDDWREKLEILKNKALVALEPVASSVFDGFTTVANWLIDTGLPALTGAFGTVKDVFETIRDDIAAGFEDPTAFIDLDGWEAVAMQFGQFFRNGVDIAIGAWNSLLPVMQTAWAWITDTALPALQTAAGAVQGAIETAWAWVTDVGVPAVVGAFDSVKAWFVDNWPAIQAVFQDAWEKMQLGFQWLIDHKGALIAALTGISLVIFGPLTTAVAGFVIAYTRLEGFRKVVDDVASWLQNSLLPAFQGAWDWIKDNTAALVAYISERWEAIKGSVETIIKVLVVAVALALAPLIFVWQNAHEQIMAIVEVVWANIQLVVGTAMRVIKDIIDIVLGLLSGDWGLAWDAIKDIPQAAFEFMIGTVQLGIDAVKAVIAGAMAILAGLWQVAWAGIQAVLAGAWSAISGAVQTGVANVVSWVAGLPGRAVGALASFAGDLQSVGSSAITALGAGAELAFGAVLHFFGTLPSLAIDALGDIGSMFATVGHNIIDAIAGAIRNSPGAIAGAIKDAALGALGSIGGVIGGAASAIAGVLGFDSGGVVPGRLGAAIPAIVHGGEVVLNQGQQARVLFAMANGAGGGGGGANVYNITLNAGMGTDPHQLSTFLVDALKRYDRGNGGVPIRATG